MKRGDALCECGHWMDRHFEEWDEATDESFFKCLNCDCDDFRQEGENERQHLQY